MFRDPKQSAGAVSTALVNDASNNATVIGGHQKKLSGFSVGGNYVAKKQSSNQVHHHGTKSMAAGVGVPIAGSHHEIKHTRTKSQGRQRQIRFNEILNSGPEYSLLGKACPTGAIASGGQITTAKKPGSDEQEIVKARASPHRLANSMDRSTFRQEQSNDRMNEQSSLQLIPFLESDKTQLMVDESNQAGGASGTGPL